MKEYTGTVAESWMPTYENVTREFITETLYKILFEIFKLLLFDCNFSISNSFS